jgi:hypothetical protein
LDTVNKPTDRADIAPRPAQFRSRISNGSDLLPDVDGRSTAARRYRDIVAALVSDQGGPERLSEVRLQLCRRFAGIAVQAEVLEARLARGEPVDAALHSTLTTTMTRVAARLGLDRIAHEIQPMTLRDRIAAMPSLATTADKATTGHPNGSGDTFNEDTQ